jgi:SAM-dependent methyltransferase
MMNWLLETPPRKIYHAFAHKILPNLKYLPRSELRRCRCCGKRSVILHFAMSEEFCFCVRCRATLRYEMIADYLTSKVGDLSQLDVLELDRASPLRVPLQTAKSYTRTFYNRDVAIGLVQSDGAQMQDVTRMGFADASFDLIVSSEVLEHVPDISAAFAEIYRVLRPGGCHVFTVPPMKETKQLAKLENGQVVQLVQPPEYHGDPLGDGGGILAFWHFGPSFPKQIETGGLDVTVVSGPEGYDQRVVWCARRPAAAIVPQGDGLVTV